MGQALICDFANAHLPKAAPTFDRVEWYIHIEFVTRKELQP